MHCAHRPPACAATRLNCRDLLPFPLPMANAGPSAAAPSSSPSGRGCSSGRGGGASRCRLQPCAVSCSSRAARAWGREGQDVRRQGKAGPREKGVAKYGARCYPVPAATRIAQSRRPSATPHCVTVSTMRIGPTPHCGTP